MFKTKKISVAIAAAALVMGLSGCGKDNYQGTYTGYEIRSQGTTGTGTTGVGYSQARAVTLTLSNNGDVVTGTYQVTNTNTYSGNTGNTNLAQETYQFTASSEQSGQLTNVMLISTGGGYGYSQYSNCLMQGSLTSQNRGQVVNGTLSAATGAASNCGSLQLSLTRGN